MSAGTRVLCGVLLLFARPTPLPAQTGPGPFARIAVARPRAGMEARFEAGYRRHLEWHRGNRDPWAWYGWSVVFGERVGWFLDATFGRSAASLDSAITPAADGRDYRANVAPYSEVASNSIYQFLPELSGGGPAPPPSPYAELAIYDLKPDAGPAFERALRSREDCGGGCLWFRLAGGGVSPRYLRLRPLAGLAEAATRRDDRPEVLAGVERLTVEVLRYRPDLSLGVRPTAEP